MEKEDSRGMATTRGCERSEMLTKLIFGGKIAQCPPTMDKDYRWGQSADGNVFAQHHIRQFSYLNEGVERLSILLPFGQFSNDSRKAALFLQSGTVYTW